MKQLIQDYYAAFNSGNRAAMLDMLDEQVVHEVNESGAETGREAFTRFLDRMDQCYQEQVEELVVFTSDDANRAAAEFFIQGRYLATDAGLPEATGQTYRLRVGAFFEARAGKITRVTNYYNLALWLRLIGG